MSPTPSTPTPPRFLLAKRSAQAVATPAPHARFQSTPRFGSSSATQKREHHVEDVDEEEDNESREDSLDADEDEAAAGPAVQREARDCDSIEAESGGWDASQGDEDHSSRRATDLESGDEEHGLPEGRKAKRRKLSMSPVQESRPPSGQSGDAGTVSDDERPGYRDADLLRSKENDGHPAGDASPAQQPVFHPAPRFKPTETEAADGFAAAFSPQRRGAQYLPDGLAAELQGWLSEIKGRQGEGAAADTLCIVVAEVRPGRQMHLVKSRARGGEEPRSFILAGQGTLTGLGSREAVVVGSVVTVAPPVWDVQLDGGTWTVGYDWDVA